MSSVKGVWLIGGLNGNDSSRRRKEERVWGETYQGLLKRVGASLGKLEILEKRKFGMRGEGRFMKGTSNENSRG